MDNLLQIGTFSTVHDGATVGPKSFVHILILDGAVVLTNLGNTIASDFVCLVGFVSLNGTVMDTALMLSHQNVVLFALLLGFDLIIQRSYIVLFNHLAFNLSCMLLVFDVIDAHADLICIKGIVLPI